MRRWEAMLLAVGAALWLAGLIAWQLALPIDASLFDALRAPRGSVAGHVAAIVTLFGDYGLLIVPTIIAAILLAGRGNGRMAIWLVAVTLGGRGLTELQKWMFYRPRPPSSGRLVDVSSASFPSAHAFNSMLVALALALALGAHRSAIAAAVMFSLAVGTSRIVLGVHWPSDVVAGWGSALFWLLALRTRAQPRDQPR